MKLNKYCLLFLLPLSCFSQEIGKASWYGNELRGHLMANNQPFDPDQLTCASWNYNLGTYLKVINLDNNKFVIVQVTDRGPNKKLNRIIDMSKNSFAAIADIKLGIINVKVEKVK